MNFYQPKNKKDRVPIVPLIDILTILLIFFIVTRGEPPKEEKIENPPAEPRDIVQINLPLAKEIATSEVVDKRAVLAVRPDGTIRLGSYELASPELLTDALIVFRRENPQLKLELAADEGATLAQLFLVWDALTAAEYNIKDVPTRIRLPKAVDFVDPLQP